MRHIHATYQNECDHLAHPTAKASSVFIQREKVLGLNHFMENYIMGKF
jgi:uncharacterized radical SAM superfamily Fe-S cluster-containing enzyme